MPCPLPCGVIENYRAPSKPTHRTGCFLAEALSGLARYPPVDTRMRDATEYSCRAHGKCQLIRTKLVDLHAQEYQALLKKHRSLQSKEGNRVWVQNRTNQPGIYPKLDRIWQGTAEIPRKASTNTHLVNLNAKEAILSVGRVKPYIPERDDVKLPLHRYSEGQDLNNSSYFLQSMTTLRSVLDRRKAVREKKIHRVLYTWRFGLIEYYMCCLRCLEYVWCERRKEGVVVGNRQVVIATTGCGWLGKHRGFVMRAGPSVTTLRQIGRTLACVGGDGVVPGDQGLYPGRYTVCFPAVERILAL